MWLAQSKSNGKLECADCAEFFIFYIYFCLLYKTLLYNFPALHAELPLTKECSQERVATKRQPACQIRNTLKWSCVIDQTTERLYYICVFPADPDREISC